MTLVLIPCRSVDWLLFMNMKYMITISCFKHKNRHVSINTVLFFTTGACKVNENFMLVIFVHRRKTIFVESLLGRRIQLI